MQNPQCLLCLVARIPVSLPLSFIVMTIADFKQSQIASPVTSACYVEINKFCRHLFTALTKAQIFHLLPQNKDSYISTIMMQAFNLNERKLDVGSKCKNCEYCDGPY